MNRNVSSPNCSFIDDKVESSSETAAINWSSSPAVGKYTHIWQAFWAPGRDIKMGSTEDEGGSRGVTYWSIDKCHIIIVPPLGFILSSGRFRSNESGELTLNL